jgi:hypothetical protein
MSIIGKFKRILSRFKVNLTSLDNQPLGKAAMVIILFLDLFILISIFDGLDEHTKQLTSPDDSIPVSCRDIVIDMEWNETNRIDHLSRIMGSTYDRVEESGRELHPLCMPYLELLEQIKHDNRLDNVFEDRGNFFREAEDLQREISNLKGAYDTSLLERVAGEREGQANVEKIKGDVREKTNRLNILRGQITALEFTINNNEKVGPLWEKLQALQQSDREKLKSDLKNLTFWYPVKQLGMQMIFLLPLLAIFSLWNGVSIRKGRSIQALVSSHLMVVSFIPILFRIVETVNDIIPKILLKKLIELLERLNLVAIWYYLLIAVAVAVALILVYFFQKKLFSVEKLRERRISKGECQSCGKYLPVGSSNCPFCGFGQFKVCSHCNRATFVYGSCCRECGKEQ